MSAMSSREREVCIGARSDGLSVLRYDRCGFGVTRTPGFNATTRSCASGHRNSDSTWAFLHLEFIFGASSQKGAPALHLTVGSLPYNLGLGHK